MSSELANVHPTRVRPFRPSDAHALAALFHASVRQGGKSDYSTAQVAAWSPQPPAAEDYYRRAATTTLLVAIDDHGGPIGYGDLTSSGLIDHLYCDPRHIGRGVGSALHVAIEAAARKAGIATLAVDASEAARRLFARRGFILVARQEFILRGTVIHNYRMTKPLR